MTSARLRCSILSASMQHDANRSPRDSARYCDCNCVTTDAVFRAKLISDAGAGQKKNMSASFWSRRGFAGALDEQRAKLITRLIAMCRESQLPVPPGFASVAQRCEGKKIRALIFLNCARTHLPDWL